MVRQAFVQGFNVAGGILLARALTPSEFGILAVVTFTVAVATALTDVGLTAGLVRQPDDPSDHDFRAVLALQHILTLSLAVGLWCAAPWLVRIYALPPSGVTMFRLLAPALPLIAIQATTSARLERVLAFDRLVIVETVQALTFNVTAVAMVWSHHGIASFGVALLLRAIAGAILACILAPWPIGWAIDLHRLRGLLAFGLPYQGATIVNLLKDSLTPALVGLRLGTMAVGHINWAQMVSSYPVMALMALQRVYLPSFSRVQRDAEQLRPFIENVIRLTNAAVAPLAILTLVLIEPATTIVFGDKWRAALPVFYLLWVANLVVPTATPLLGLLNALGRSRTTLGFALLWMLLTWLIGWPGVVLFGEVGFGVANLIIQITGLLLWQVVRQQVPFRLFSVVGPPWGVAIGAGIIVFLVRWMHPPNSLLELAGIGMGGLLLYGLGLAFMWRRRLETMFHLLGGVRGTPNLGRP